MVKSNGERVFYRTAANTARRVHTLDTRRMPSVRAAPPRRRSTPILGIAAWHKAGIELSKQLATPIASVGSFNCTPSASMRWAAFTGGNPFRCNAVSPQCQCGWRVRLWCDPTESASIFRHGDRRLVVIVRDPLDLAVSSYIYHMRSNDIRDSGFRSAAVLRKHFRKQNATQGLLFQAGLLVRMQSGNHSAPLDERTGPPGIALRMQRVLREAPWNSSLVLYMHNFTSSSASFDRTVECLYHFLLDGLASPQEMVQLRREATRFDLHRVASQHAADSGKTAAVRATLDSMSHTEEYQALVTARGKLAQLYRERRGSTTTQIG